MNLHIILVLLLIPLVIASEITVFNNYNTWDGVRYCEPTNTDKDKLYTNSSNHYRCYVAVAYRGNVYETLSVMALTIDSWDYKPVIKELGSTINYVKYTAKHRFELIKKFSKLATIKPDIYYNSNQSFIAKSCYIRWEKKAKYYMMTVAGVTDFFCQTSDFVKTVNNFKEKKVKKKMSAGFIAGIILSVLFGIPVLYFIGVCMFTICVSVCSTPILLFQN